MRHPHGPTGLTERGCASCREGTCGAHARAVVLYPGDPGYARLRRSVERAAARPAPEDSL